MFYPGKILKLAPADSREDKRKMVRESFQNHFRRKYAKSFVVNSIPSTINEKVDLKCKQCGQVTIRRAESIVKGTFSGNCAYCCLHDSKKAENHRKKLKNILSKNFIVDYLSSGDQRIKQTIIKCKCGYHLAASYNRIINKSIRQQCPKCGRDVFKNGK